jgi:hypothetical protein
MRKEQQFFDFIVFKFGRSYLFAHPVYNNNLLHGIKVKKCCPNSYCMMKWFQIILIWQN